MIEVFIHKSGDHYTKLRVEGHAGYAEHGKDIVCAAVSALTITLENSFGKLSDVPVMTSQYINEDHPNIIIPVPSDKTDLLIEAYKIGIEDVQVAYPDYVKLHLEI